MGRLTDKFKQAQNAISGVELDIERDLDGVIQRTQELHKKREDIMLRKQMALDSHMSALAEFGKDLEAFDGKNEPSAVGSKIETNGGHGNASGDAYVATRPKVS